MAEIVEKPKSFNAKEIVKTILRHENGILVIILVGMIAMFAGLTHGLTTSRANAFNILVQSSTRGLAAIGQLFVILTAGIDISVGGLAVLACCIGGVISGTESGAYGYGGVVFGLPLAVGILGMLGVGALVGTINGLSVSRLRMPPLIVTLAMWQITLGIALQMTGGFVIGGLPPALSFLGSGRVVGIPVPIIVFVVASIIGYFVLNYTTFGRSVYAVGGNPVSAWLSGINVKNIQFFVFIISGCLAGFAGLIAVARIMAASMTVMAGLELDSIAAVCIGGVSLMGGRGTLIGAVLGALVIGVINNGLNIMGVGAGIQGLVKGLIIFIAVAVDMARRR